MTNESSLLKYKREIGLLKPMESGFVFNYRRWNIGYDYDKNYIDLFKDFDSKEITRLDVIHSFRQYFEKKNENCFIPFLLAMIWGYGKSGFGPHRTNKYFVSENNRSHIKKAMELLSSKAVYEAYAELLLINGLNVSFASKITYFAGRALDLHEYPLIFDNRVANSLVSIFIGNEISNLVSVNPKTDLESYKRYNSLIHKWAREINVEADNIELYLFNENLK